VAEANEHQSLTSGRFLPPLARRPASLRTQL